MLKVRSRYYTQLTFVKFNVNYTNIGFILIYTYVTMTGIISGRLSQIKLTVKLEIYMVREAI